MPLFPRKSTPKEEAKSGTLNNHKNHNNNNNNNNNNKACQVDAGALSVAENDRPPMVFQCQLAEGSPTGFISGFNNVKELYQKISECYDIDPNQILFCTLNTHKINMNNLLGGQILLNDFIFVHRKGRPKEVELTKKEEALGLTITDNGNGLAFIKKIKPGSVIDEIPVIQVGDHIEKINNDSLVGKRHFDVAKYLKEIPLGSTFTLRLISPLQAGFCNIGPREDRGKGRKGNYGSGKETLRFKAGGPAVVEIVEDNAMFEMAIDGINELLEDYIGINDTELATRLWEISEGKENSLCFLQALAETDIGELGLSDDFVFQLWDVITNARDKRL